MMVRHQPRTDQIMGSLRTFLRDEQGATAIEYTFIAALISLAIFAGLNAIGPKLNTKFAAVSTGLGN